MGPMWLLSFSPGTPGYGEARSSSPGTTGILGAGSRRVRAAGRALAAQAAQVPPVLAFRRRASGRRGRGDADLQLPAER